MEKSISSGFSLKSIQEKAKKKRTRKNLNQSVRVMLNSEQKYKLLLEAEQQSTTISVVVRNLINQYL